MKQIIQSYRTGELKLKNVPFPALDPREVMVQTAYSAVSLGTEGKKVSTARQSLVGKARSRPDLVRQVMQTAQREGIVSTYHKVIDRLDEPVPLGYSAAGTVIAVGREVEAFRVGDRVACAGEGIASHAEMIAVPVNLCARVPDGVGLGHAAFATIGAIALQGVRQADVTLGECVAVIGLGLVGQLAVQLLKANGCRVLGIDLDPGKVSKAQEMGADAALARSDPNLVATVAAFSRGRGMDAVLITAAGPTNDPAELAVELCRDRGRIVVVGGVKMDLPRDACYMKELEVKLSRSYGPGRYDPTYEERGVDYPIGYVRWTEQRNMEAFLDLLAAGRINLDGLVTHQFPFENAQEAYTLLAEKHADGPAPLGIVFEYDAAKDHLAAQMLRIPTTKFTQTATQPSGAMVGVGFIGAGSFARKHLIPPLMKDPRVRLVGVSTASGASGQHTAEKFGVGYSTGEYRQIIEDPDIGAVFIATQHNLHAALTVEALQAGKSVFVEKPLALSGDELSAVVAAYEETNRNGDGPVLQVGFNRRFAPLTRAMVEFFQSHVEPMIVNCRINAGFIPNDHWVHDREVGGGRLLGEVCHFIDLANFLVQSAPRTVYVVGMDNSGRYHDDNVNVTITYADGSVANISYMANGDTALPKERIEVHCQGKSAVLDDFCRLETYQSGQRRVRKSTQDKGHMAELAAFVDAARGGDGSLSQIEGMIVSSWVTLYAQESLRTGTPISLASDDPGRSRTIP